MNPHPYPRSNRTMQLEGHCPSLQNVTALDVDYMRGRLWVLDAGTVICRPKVLVFDLRKNEEVRQVEIISHLSGEMIKSVSEQRKKNIWPEERRSNRWMGQTEQRYFIVCGKIKRDAEDKKLI